MCPKASSAEEGPAKIIWIFGSPGAGKSTLAAAYQDALGYRHVELDAMYWQPGWVSNAPDRMLTQTRDAVRDAPCVIDGSYPAVDDFLIEKAHLAVFIDLPISLLLWRVCRRSLRNLWLREELWNGNRESLGKFFISDPIWLHLIRSYSQFRKKSRKVEMAFAGSGRPFVRIRSHHEFRNHARALARTHQSSAKS